MVTVVPGGPLVGLMPVMERYGSTVKGIPLLACPATVTTTLPVVAREGTETVMAVLDHALAVAVTPLKVMVLVP